MLTKTRLTGAFLILLGIASLLHIVDYYTFAEVPQSVLITSRLFAWAAFIAYALKKRSLTTWILVSMVLGVEIGLNFPDFAQNLQVLSSIFLKLIKTIIAPILFSTLVVGIAGHANLKQVGRMGWKSLLYFEAVTTIALVIGIVCINITQAGTGISVPPGLSQELPETKPQNWQDLVLHIFPENIAKSIYHGDVLPIVVFSVLFAISMAMISEEKRRPVLSFAEGLSETMFKFTHIVMYFAPIGVGAAIAVTVGHMGIDILGSLLKLLLTLYGALFIFILFVLVPIALIARVPIRKFIKAVSEPASIAFATTTSEAALPKALENMQKLGVPPKIASFVLPTGYTFNLDGSTLYLSLAAVFVAQAAGVQLSFADQALMVFTLMLTSKGIAGIPRASLVILMGTVASFGLPMWPVLAILGIDELMDMARTGVNLIGNCLASVVIARWEGEYQEPAGEITF